METRGEANKLWRLVALDIDGTVLPRDAGVSAENRRWISRARQLGLEVTFATGRHRSSMVEQLAKELGFTVPFVTANGSEVWTPDGKLLERHTLPVEDIFFLQDLAGQYKANYWAAMSSRVARTGQFPDPKDYSKYEWLKFGFWSRDASAISGLWQALREHGGFELSNSDPSNIEINPLGVNKASGLKVVCEYVGIDPGQMVAIGDSLNDIPMIEMAGLGVAMGNAQQPVKDAADRVAPAVDEDGVAKTLRFLLEQMGK